MSIHTFAVLKGSNIPQILLDLSIELHNDDEIFAAIQNLAIVDLNPAVDFDRETILKVLDFYFETESRIVKEFDKRDYDPVLIKYYIEDLVWQQFGLELNDFIAYCEKQLREKDIDIKFGDLRSSMSSIQKNEKRRLRHSSAGIPQKQPSSYKLKELSKQSYRPAKGRGL